MFSFSRAVRLGMRLVRSGRAAQTRVLEALARLRYRDPVGPAGALGPHLARAARATSPELLAVIVGANVEAHGAERVTGALRDAMAQLAGERRPRARRTLLAAALDALVPHDAPAALALGDELVDELADRRIALQLARLQVAAGGIERPLQLMLRHELVTRPDRQAKVARLRAQADLLRQGYTFEPAAGRAWQPASERRILYYLSQCLPHHSSGYAIRTHGLLRQLGAAGWDVTGVARFGYPNDRHDFLGAATAAGEAEVDGVRYLFQPDPWGFRAVDDAYVARASRELADQAARLRPALIHAASNYQVGLAGVAAARSLGLPSIYEVRGLWHLSRTSKDPAYAGSDHYRMSERLEVQAARSADRVLVITEALLDHLADQGVERSRMAVLPNAVDVDEFAPRPRDEELADRLGLDGATVIGFVGTFKSYEGLDLLLEAAASLRGRVGDRFRLLLVGDGPDAGRIEALRRRLGLERIVHMTGRVPHAEVARYYSVIDVMAYPRTGDLVCQLVSPLKPLEAMAMEKAVVASDVRAQAEMVAHEHTGLLHAAGDAASLATQLERLILEPELRRELGSSARAWVRARRSWREVARAVEAVYHDILGS